jgi:hypothetical protein
LVLSLLQEKREERGEKKGEIIANSKRQENLKMSGL